MAAISLTEALDSLTTETVPKIHGQAPRHFTSEWMCDPTVIVETLYRTHDLTDEAFNDIVDNIGSRAARLVLRAKALSGDIKALDLYDRVVYRDKQDRRKAKPVAAEKNVTPFIQEARASSSEHPSTPQDAYQKVST